MVSGKSFLRVAGALPVLLVACSLQAESAAPDPQATAERLRGSWRAEISDSQTLLLEFEGESVGMKIEAAGSATPVWTGKFVIAAEHADCHMDWVQLKAGERAIPDNRCLFRLAGDTLLVIGGGPTTRPAHFFSGPGSEPKALIFTRESPAKP